jgi:hypothetical protein
MHVPVLNVVVPRRDTFSGTFLLRAYFRDLAHAVMANDSRVIPTPVNDLAELEKMYRVHQVKKYGNRPVHPGFPGAVS